MTVRLNFCLKELTMFSAMDFQGNTLRLIDQRRLPNKEIWIECENLESVAKAIEDMVVRGAPAIGCTAAWGLAIDAANHTHLKVWSDYKLIFDRSSKRLAETRPTAVNLFFALHHMGHITREFDDDLPMIQVASSLKTAADDLTKDDIRTCKAIGDHGATLFDQPVNVLTHCNTGSLATAGYGTALGVIRSLHEKKCVRHVWVDETRPYLQGSRLTAFELGHDKIPYSVISDNMAGYLMQLGRVDLVVVGADRIATNGDTANKIGTYALAVLCQHHKIPFVVAAPRSTIDFKIQSGLEIPVEERPAKELREINGMLMTPQDAAVWNPSFDVTPSPLIHAIVTEDGVFKGPDFRFNA
jgi:methylthioribose-1-phosphate isomerase